MLANLENSAVATGLEKVSFHSKTKERQCKECSNCHTIALISHSSKVMLKILHARLQNYMNQELDDVKLYLVKKEEPEIKLPTFIGSCRKQGNSRKTSSVSLTMLKPFSVWITTNWKIHKEMGVIRPPYLFPEKPACGSRGNIWNQSWDNLLVPNWERSTTKLYIVTLLIYLLCKVHHVKC